LQAQDLDFIDAPIPIRTPSATTRAGDGLTTGPCSLVPVPAWRNAAGQLMFAVATANGSDLYGLFADDGGSNRYWNYLATLPLPQGAIITAINSLSGSKILVGARGLGQIYLVDLGANVRISSSSGLPANASGNAFVVSIIVVSDTEAFAIWSDFDHDLGEVYHSTNLAQWTRVGTGLSGKPLVALAADRRSTPTILFAATDQQVYVSRNGGRTWASESDGLPRCAHCSDMTFVIGANGIKQLHLTTSGWSSWVTLVT
jgi:hypothetical protein